MARPSKPFHRAAPKVHAVPQTDLDQLLRQALTLHRQGQLDAAARAYDEILRFVPEHPDALHLSGVIADLRLRHSTVGCTAYRPGRSL